MSICHKCGSEIAEDESFCPLCGVSDIGLSEYDNTLNMPFPDDVKIEAEKPMPDIGEKTLEEVYVALEKIGYPRPTGRAVSTPK